MERSSPLKMFDLMGGGEGDKRRSSGSSPTRAGAAERWAKSPKKKSYLDRKELAAVLQPGTQSFDHPGESRLKDMSEMDENGESKRPRASTEQKRYG